VSRLAGAAAPAALFALGAFGAWSALRYGVWDGGPGAGMLPGLASVALCIFAAVAAFERSDQQGEPAHVPRLAGYVAGLAGFALLMGPLGAVLAIIALFVWTLGLVERWPWRRVLLIAAAAALFAWVLFDRLLQVPLPKGLLG
jgi:putative tricarboxylic transport membrane protein